MNEMAGLHIPAPTLSSVCRLIRPPEGRRYCLHVQRFGLTDGKDVTSSQPLKLFTHSANVSPHFGAEGLFCPGCFLFPSHQRSNTRVVGGRLPISVTFTSAAIQRSCVLIAQTLDQTGADTVVLRTLVTIAGGFNIGGFNYKQMWLELNEPHDQSDATLAPPLLN